MRDERRATSGWSEARSSRARASPLTSLLLFDSLTFMETSKALMALAALAQETRLTVYRLLVEYAPAGLPAGQIAERLDIPAPSLSFHLKELWRAGLIVPRQEGRFIWYRADLNVMNALLGYLTENCCGSSICPAPKALPRCARTHAAPSAKRRKSA
jgi:DNA-binding transcriptional ArsR family regulator